MTRQLLQNKRQLIGAAALSCAIALLAAALNAGVISLLPPRVTANPLQVSAAATNILVDAPDSSIVRKRTLPQDLTTLVKHTELLARVLASPPATQRIAQRAGIPPDELAGIGRITSSVPVELTEPGREQRASEIAWSQHAYRLEVQARPTVPIIDVYAQAPSTDEATRIADLAAAGLRDVLHERADAQNVPRSELVQLRPLGRARGGVVNGGAVLVIGGLTFLTTFALVFAALVGLMVVRAHRDSAPSNEHAEPSSGAVAATPQWRSGRLWASGARRVDDWPRTNRVLPWLLAAFMALLWLTPFNSIELDVSFPIELRLDRLLLPFIIGLWLVALLVGGRLAPRIRLTWIHAALAIFLACAFLSVVLDARSLNQTLELDQSLKKLPLLVSYISLFVIVASVVRPGEVRNYLIYTLILATVLALGMIWEYRFKQNLFYSWSDKLLPGAFLVAPDSPLEVDALGRRFVRGSAGAPLEAVTMLSLALPIALVGLLSSPRRGKILYTIAACALVAAMFATYRKSALLAPVAVVLTLAYFRRRELLKLAPLGLALIVVVSALSPGAIGSTIHQFTRADRSSVATVSDRTADYDAVRPDVWSDLAFGRGWGSYDHVDYRILDSEILHRTIEMGVVGLLSFLLVAISVIAVARGPIAERDPAWAPVALVGAAGAAAFLIAATLYDVMSFPHGPYIFLYLAGLVAVASRPAYVGSGPQPAPRASEHARRVHRQTPTPQGRRRIRDVRRAARAP